MSLAIDVDKVEGVLLADGWHTVIDQSFLLDAYEYLYADARQREEGDSTTVHGGGDSDVCATGFLFTTDGEVVMAGPLTAILAVRGASLMME